MRARLMVLWDRLHSNFWFVPLLMSFISVSLALLLPWMDERMALSWESRIAWTTISADSARGILSSIAGAMVTVSGVVFSITIVALTVASSQFGPRLLRTFMANGSTHFAFGTFVSASIYSMMVLASVRDYKGEQYVPQLSVLFSVIIALLALVVLVYFVHSIATLIQAPNIVRAVAKDLNRSITSIYPAGLGVGPQDPEERRRVEEQAANLPEEAGYVRSDSEGYLQLINVDELLKLSTGTDVIVKMLVAPGNFIGWSSRVAMVWPKESSTPELEKAINGVLIVGNRPTPLQDIEGAVNELVELAVRCMSPGINDPFTARTCIDYLGSALSRLVTCDFPSVCRLDAERRLRVIVRRPDFRDVLASAFNQIRQNSSKHVAVMTRLLEALCLIALAADHESDLHALRMHARMVRDAALKEINEEYDRHAIESRYQEVEKALERPYTSKEFRVPAPPQAPMPRRSAN